MDFEEKVYKYAVKKLESIDKELQKIDEEISELYRNSNFGDENIKAKITMLRSDQLLLTSWREVFDEYLLAVSRNDTNKMRDLESKFLSRDVRVMDNFIASSKTQM